MRYFTNKNLIIISILAIISCLAYLKLNNKETNAKAYLGANLNTNELEAYLSDKMQQNPIPGLALGIINDGQLTYQVYKGYEDLELKKPINKQTLFEAASMSKSVFGSLVMKQVEKGLIDLDKPLFEYYPVAYMNDERFKYITARMALSHQTGWPNWRWDRKDNQLEFKHSPGETYLYSGEGYQYLAETLRHINGGDWQDLEGSFQDLIAKPLNMDNSTFIEPTPVSPLKAKPYDSQGKLVDYKQLEAYQRFNGVFVSAASLVTNLEDFSKWMVALMDERLLSAPYKKKLFKAQVGTGHQFVNEIFYTLGFFEIKVPVLAQFYGHGGNNHGFTSYFALDPEKQWGFVLMSNSEYGEELGLELLAYLATGPDYTPYLIMLVFGTLLLVCLLIATFRKVRVLLKSKV